MVLVTLLVFSLARLLHEFYEVHSLFESKFSWVVGQILFIHTSELSFFRPFWSWSNTPDLYEQTFIVFFSCLSRIVIIKI